LYRKHKHTRMPIYETDIDHIRGLIHIKDLLLYYVGGRSDFSVAKAMRKIEFVPESRKVDEALHDMQTKKVHMMIVVDEYGATFDANGITWTVEDIDGQRIGRVRLKAEQPWPDEALVGAGMKPVRRDGQTGETLIDNLGHG